MPPKGPSKGQPTIPARGQTQQSTVKNVVDAALAPENRSVLRAVGIFAVGSSARYFDQKKRTRRKAMGLGLSVEVYWMMDEG